MFYFFYTVFLFILAPFVATGRGWGGFIFFILFSAAVPFVGPLIWVWIWSTGDTTKNIRITIAMHILAAYIILMWLSSRH
ncbi:hypothetical protein GCWU000325_00826 [Alloprevotella tannerae ATCC 51259]|uniref:Uncharacterized protein n=1 Tax=Alloprevotella tannerae ATCC 51259 TaxID=626522 RepID=C9LF44_9BACT|nr:hypothetical protein GCWU000325_00826 [Alloprevotella tannerae ATCC 51259]